MTSCGLPTKFAPRSARGASKSARVIGGQPRSRPILVIIASNCGQDASAASCEVSAMKPCELMLSARHGVARLAGGAAMDLGERRESLGHPADDRERHRQAERPGARRPTPGCRRPRSRWGAAPASGRG